MQNNNYTVHCLDTGILIMLSMFLVDCKTMYGDKCMFPFTYRGVQHHTCITHDEDGSPWCYAANDKRGYCRSDCPGNLV